MSHLWTLQAPSFCSFCWLVGWLAFCLRLWNFLFGFILETMIILMRPAPLHYKVDEAENPWSLVVRRVLVVALQ